MSVKISTLGALLVILLSFAFAGRMHAQNPPPNPQAPAPGGNQAQPAQPGSPAAPGAAQQPGGQGGESPEIAELEGFLEPFIYDMVNRRDPFLAYAEFVPVDVEAPARPLSPAQRYDLDQLKLVAVLWDVKDPKAMFMAPAPDNEVLVLGRDEGIGNRNGYIATIREGEVVVVEAIRKRGEVIYKTRTLHMER